MNINENYYKKINKNIYVLFKEFIKLILINYKKIMNINENYYKKKSIIIN